MHPLQAKFENAALFIWLGLPSEVIRYENGRFFKMALQNGGI